MRHSPKNLTDVHPATWCAVFTLALVLCPLWVSYASIVVSCLGMVVLSDEKRRAQANRIRKAMAICGYSLTTAARTCGMDIADFSRMLTGERKLDLWRLEMLGDEFMRTLALLELQDRGLPEFARTAVKIESAIGFVKASA